MQVEVSRCGGVCHEGNLYHKCVPKTGARNMKSVQVGFLFYSVLKELMQKLLHETLSIFLVPVTWLKRQYCHRVKKILKSPNPILLNFTTKLDFNWYLKTNVTIFTPSPNVWHKKLILLISVNFFQAFKDKYVAKVYQWFSLYQSVDWFQ
jgi:hypothetical protein